MGVETGLKFAEVDKLKVEVVFRMTLYEARQVANQLDDCPYSKTSNYPLSKGFGGFQQVVRNADNQTAPLMEQEEWRK